MVLQQQKNPIKNIKSLEGMFRFLFLLYTHFVLELLELAKFEGKLLSKFVYLNAVFRNVSEGERLVPFRTAMVIVAFDGSRTFLEANVIESGKAGPADVLYGVVRDEEVFFPSHENVICFLHHVVVKRVRVKSFSVLVKRNKLALQSEKETLTRTFVQGFKISDNYPMFFVDVFIGVPFSG